MNSHDNERKRATGAEASGGSARGKIKNKPESSRRFWLMLIDMGCFIAAYLANAVILSVARQVNFTGSLQKWPNALILLTAVMVCRLVVGVYRNVWRYPNVRAYMSMVVADACGGLLAFFLTYTLDQLDVHNAFIGFWQTFFVIALFDLSTLVLRFAYQILHQNSHKSDRVQDNGDSMKKIGIAIVGAGQVGCHLAEELRTTPTAHYRPVCFIDRDRAKIGLHIADLMVYNEDENILDRLKTLPVQEIFVAIPGMDYEEKERIIRMYSEAGYKVKVYDFPTRDALHMAQEDFNPKRMVRDFRIEDLLGRDSLENMIDKAELVSYYRDRVVLVTGGGGSIGSEICRQIAKCHPARLIILDIYENNAYDIQQELTRKYGDKLNLAVEIASVRDVKRLECIFKAYRPQVVFHAAAHKHVPLMEHSSCEAIKNNVIGTYNTANMAEKYHVEKFVLISTDKAVNPTNVMGASKRMCEMIVQCRTDSQTAFTAVRFGNVLGSNGSVIPLFRSQIELGGPVTITDKRIIRYFMTIPEASRLVMTAGVMARNGELFVLDMGKPIRILDMAENMIRMMGYRPYEDIRIEEIGLRPGEKLYEETLIKTEELTKTKNSLIFIETDTPLSRAEVQEKIDRLQRAVAETEDELASPRIKEVMKQVVPTFREPDEVNCHADEAKEMQEVGEITAEGATVSA